MYGHLQSLELGFFDGQQTGQLMSRATVDLQSVRFFLGYGLIFMLQSALTIVLAAVAMFFVDPGLAAISLLPVPFVVLIAQRYGKKARPALQEVQQRIAELTAEVEEDISGVRVVKAFAREERQLERFRSRVARVFDQAMFSTRLQAFYNPLIGFLPQLGLAAILFFGGRQVINGHAQPGRLHRVLHLPAHAAVAHAHARHLARAGPARDRGRGAAVPDPRPRAAHHEPPGGAGAARGLRARRAARRHPRVRGHRPPRARGRLADRRGGHHRRARRRDRLGQDDARPAHPAPVRRRRPARSSSTASTSATSTCARCARRSPWSTTRRSCSRPRSPRTSPTRDPTRRSRRSQDAARHAQAHDFIARLPEGYDTQVGERGLTLSGGQRQRVAIARAFLADPRVLVLDDATSSVDASTEQEIKAALREVMAGRTTFVIAHRLSTISLADEIAVLEDGRLLAHGRHDELLERSELYREIVEKGLPDQVFLNRKAVEREVAGL